jgi:hypothetical protein
MWEGACPRFQCLSQRLNRQINPYRGQAPTHIFDPRQRFVTQIHVVTARPINSNRRWIIYKCE